MTSVQPQIVETHTGLANLLGEFAYKVKKPVVPDDRRPATTLRRGDDVTAALSEIAGVMARVHAPPARSPANPVSWNIEVIYREVLAHCVQARRVAAGAGVDIVEFACAAPPEAAVRRIRTRGATTSQATPEIATAMARRGDGHGDWPGAHRIDTTREPAESVAEATGHLPTALRGNRGER